MLSHSSPKTRTLLGNSYQPFVLSHSPKKINRKMKQSLAHVALVVNDYDDAIHFYTNTLDFELREDTYIPEQDKRWVIITPPGSDGCTLLLARASNPKQRKFIGDQAGGRVFLFLSTDDFWRDYENYRNKGVTFVREPTEFDYGTVAVFEDLYGNKWDLIEYAQRETERI